MQRAVEDAVAAFAAVPTRADRATAAAEGWTATHAELLDRLDTPISMEERETVDADAAAALADAVPEALAAYTGLAGADALAAAAEARAQLTAQLDRIAAARRAADWLGQAAVWCDKAPAEICSSDLDALTHLAAQRESLDETARFFCDETAAETVASHVALAGAKAAAVTALGDWMTFLADWDYTPENAARLISLRQEALGAIEGAADVGAADAALSAGKDALWQVDPIPKAPVITPWPDAAVLTLGRPSARVPSRAAAPGCRVAFPGRNPTPCRRRMGRSRWSSHPTTPAGTLRWSRR